MLSMLSQLTLTVNDSLWTYKIKTIKLKIYFFFKVATGKMTHKDSSNEDRSETINNTPDSMLLTSAELDYKNSTTIKDDDKPK